MTTPAPFRWALRGALGGIRHLSAVPARTATGVVARVYGTAEREFGLLPPPLALHSPAPDLLAASWLMLRESLLVDGGVDRATKEAVAAAVSVANTCPYCVEVHGAVLGGLADDAAGRRDAAALAADRLDDVADPTLRATARWVRGDGPSPLPAEHTPELLAVVLTFHYINRMVRVFLGESPLPPALPRAASGAARGMLGRVLRGTARRGAVPGRDLDLLPPAALPADLAWAAGDPVRADALARACAAVEAAGARVLSAAARELLGTAVADAAPRGLLDDPAAGVAALDPAERPAARLALLTAVAPERVDAAAVAAFRARFPEPADLVAVVARGALTAAVARTRDRAGRIGADF